MTKNHEHKPTGAGKSSFGLIDTAKFFRELDLKKGVTFLDVACGWGSYSLAASDIRKEADSKGFQNMATFVSDVAQNIPIENDCVDVCLMATVLHDLVGDQADRGAMKEIVRVLKPEGILVIVEYKKIDGPPGPPKSVRLSPQEVDTLVSAYGFKQKRYTEIGDSHYLQIFKRIA